jgi:predicted aldo/keto reductase-like oxidoreductase
MEKRTFESLGITTGLLGFGGMRFPMIDGEIDQVKATELLEVAYQNGVNYYDTAIVYHGGKSEEFMGGVISKWDRNTYYLATKLTLGIYQTKEEVMQAIDIQLGHLQTGYIDFYLIHAMNANRLTQLKEWGIIEILENWKREGKIKHIGFSFHDSYQVFIDILNYYHWDFCQIQLNYIDQTIQQGIKGYYECEQRNIPVIVMEPVKGGKLASFHPSAEAILKAYHNDKSIASWAMRWVGSLPNVKVILSGMTQLNQLLDNLDTFNHFVPLTQEEYALIEEVGSALHSVTKVGCTSCEYCLPCPVGVDIPGNFHIYNQDAMFHNESAGRWSYSVLVKKNADASVCVECGECIPKCPQHINIPVELSKMREELEFIKDYEK